MSGHPQLHDDEIAISGGLARTLIQAQFPHWGHLPLRRIRSSGTVNAIFRLGDDLAVRLPRTPGYTNTSEAIAAHHAWLSWARPALPLLIPEPVAAGDPTADYPWP